MRIRTITSRSVSLAAPLVQIIGESRPPRSTDGLTPLSLAPPTDGRPLSRRARRDSLLSRACSTAKTWSTLHPKVKSESSQCATKDKETGSPRPNRPPILPPSNQHRQKSLDTPHNIPRRNRSITCLPLTLTTHPHASDHNNVPRNRFSRPWSRC